MQARRLAMVFPGVLLMALSAAAQMPMGQAPRFRGVWKPVVGSGSAYAVETKGEPKRNVEIAIVGAETAQGKSAHWLEMVFQDPQQGEVVMKNLIIAEGGNTRVARMIFQTREMGAMEFPSEMMGMGRRQGPQDADIRDDATLVGTEAVTVPAGTFECEHYRAKDGGADVWISDKVAPWGMVKMTSRDSTMVLTRVLTGVKTRVTGTPKKFDMSEMMREHPE